jgi:hypothetical protein
MVGQAIIQLHPRPHFRCPYVADRLDVLRVVQAPSEEPKLPLALPGQMAAASLAKSTLGDIRRLIVSRLPLRPLKPIASKHGPRGEGRTRNFLTHHTVAVPHPIRLSCHSISQVTTGRVRALHFTPLLPSSVFVQCEN